MTRAEFRARVEPRPGRALGRDRVRQVAVIASVVFAVIAGIVALRSPDGVAGLQSGAFDDDGSFLAVALAAYGIWVLLGAGLVAYAIWQALPMQTTARRQRAVGWWIAAAAALDGVWCVAALFGPVWATVPVAFVLLGVLIVAYVRAVVTAEPRSAWVELLLVDGLVGVHVGWMIFAAPGDLAAMLTTLSPAFWTARAPLWGTILVIVVAVGALAASAFAHWRVMPPLAVAWALMWVAIGRMTGEPYGEGVAITAAICAVILALLPALVRVTLALRSNVD
jgi:hypothetical protein